MSYIRTGDLSSFKIIGSLLAEYKDIFKCLFEETLSTSWSNFVQIKIAKKKPLQQFLMIVILFKENRLLHKIGF